MTRYATSASDTAALPPVLFYRCRRKMSTSAGRPMALFAADAAAAAGFYRRR